MKTKILLIVFLASCLFCTQRTNAEELISDCGVGDNQASALIQMPAGELDYYVKANRSEDTGSAELYFQNIETGECTKLGSVTLKQNKYTKVGSMNSAASAGQLTLIMSNDSVSEGGSSGPSLIITDPSAQPCSDMNDCRVSFDDKEFQLSPKKISFNIDTLRVGLLLPVKDNAVLKVIYSVDSKPAYQTEKIEDFNLNYVPDGEHRLSRTVVLSSGQSLSDKQFVKRGLDGGFVYFFWSLIYGQGTLIKYVLLLVAALVLVQLTLFYIRKLRAKRFWYKTHFNVSQKVDTSKAGFKNDFSFEEGFWKTLYRFRILFISIVSVFALLVVANQYIIGYFTVDGVSMYPTFEDKSRQLLYKLPVSLSKINNSGFTPNRGDVVVIEKEDNNLFNVSEVETKEYVVKRVVGLPGDRVLIKSGIITIYNKDNEHGFVPDDEYQWVSDLTGSEQYYIDITLKAGELFVVGDNRDESIDSRIYGPVQSSLVVGKVLYNSNNKQ